MLYSYYPPHASIHPPLLREATLPSQMRLDGLGITVLITPHTNLPIVATYLPIVKLEIKDDSGQLILHYIEICSSNRSQYLHWSSPILKRLDQLSSTLMTIFFPKTICYCSVSDVIALQLN